MPLGPYANWAECHGAQMRKGHTSEEADKICGALEAELGGSLVTSQDMPQLTTDNNMSAPENPFEKKEDKPEAEGLKLTAPETETVVQALLDAQTALESAPDVNPEVKAEVAKAVDVVSKEIEVVP